MVRVPPSPSTNNLLLLPLLRLAQATLLCLHSSACAYSYPFFQRLSFSLSPIVASFSPPDVLASDCTFWLADSCFIGPTEPHGWEERPLSFEGSSNRMISQQHYPIQILPTVVGKS
jgi:hypothetical protein